MDQDEFFSALGTESTDRIRYGETLGVMKDLFLDFSKIIFWLDEASANWDEVNNPDLISMVGERISELSDIGKKLLGIFMTELQSISVHLYGEKLAEKTWHAPGCDCQDEEE